MSRCYVEGHTTVATLTDHIVPHRGDRTLFWDQEHNWQALCEPCHMRKSQSER